MASFLTVADPLIWQLPFLFLLPWLVYADALKGQWVSDDIAGMANFDGKLQHPVSVGKLLRKLRYELGKRPNPNRQWKLQKQPPFLPSSIAHHRLNLWIAGGMLGSLYLFLRYFFSSHLAFLSCVLFGVHPLGSQIVAWISGIGYALGAFWMLLSFHWVMLATSLGWTVTLGGTILSLLGFSLLYWLAVEIQFATIGGVLILLWMGQWPFALVGSLIAGYGLLHTFREAIVLRTATFKEQQMGEATQFHLRRLIVVLKTLAYNTQLALFPKRMGLYHTFCYHYEKPYVEVEERYTLVGLCLVLGASIAYWQGPPVVQLSLLWYGAFIIIFLNWITANQFVVDRYVWLPSFGLCLLAAAYLPPWAFWLLCGIALMRTWAHLPTFYNELQFYLSNLWNFPSSEVAAGNLGVAYLSQGLVGSAMDSWMMGMQLRSDYDVNWYNLSSLIASRGPLNPNYAPRLFNQFPPELLTKSMQQDPARQHLHVGRYLLARAVSSPTCHFPRQWIQELAELDRRLLLPVGVVETAPIIRPLVLEAETR